jgi:hypothetical protein
MISETFSKLFLRDLKRLSKEIESYSDEADLWIVRHEISNSAGNLCLHLLGNLNAYIGANLGKTGYVRDRPAEFSLKDIPKDDLLNNIKSVSTIIEKVFLESAEDVLHEIYPEEVLGYPMNTEYFLIHLYGHLNYHLGQINYHRRLLAS